MDSSFISFKQIQIHKNTINLKFQGAMQENGYPKRRLAHILPKPNPSTKVPKHPYDFLIASA